MSTTIHQSDSAQDRSYNSRAYVYYSRYPVAKPTDTRFQWRKAIRNIWNYTRLFLVAGIMMVLGAILPLLIAGQLFFSPLINNDCDKCLITGGRPFFEMDLIGATFMAVLGIIIPILVLYFLIKILRSRSFRRDLFY